MKSEASAEMILKRTAQSDMKTEMRNKQETHLMRKNVAKVMRNAEVAAGNYMRERAQLLADMKRASVEMNMFRQEMRSRGGGGPRSVSFDPSEGQQQERGKSGRDKADDVFKALMADHQGEDGGGGDPEEDVEASLDPRIARMKLLQRQHERLLRRRCAKFAGDIEEDKSKLRQIMSGFERSYTTL